jgi:hypothetical protein
MTRAWLRIGALSMALVLMGCTSAPPKAPTATQALEAPARAWAS